MALPDGGTIAAPENFDVAQITEVGMRPEHLKLVAADEGNLTVTVTLVEELGGETYIYGSTDSLVEIRIKLPGVVKVARGDRIGTVADPDRIIYFSGNQAVGLPEGLK